jgi:hypothetical protein
MPLPRALAVAEQELGPTVEVEDFLLWSEWALARVGFRPSNCLAVVDVCRDELMARVDASIARVWGRPFQVGSLAALVFLGRTGLQAALGHVPGEDGRHRFVVFCLPHIGIDEHGTVGRVQRRGMHRGTSACGALAAFRADLAVGAGAPEPGLDPDDVEQSLLRQRLLGMIDAGEVPGLPALTELARRAAVEDMHRFIDLARGSEPVDVAYLSGIVVHLPEGVECVSAVQAEVVIDGEVIELPH